MDKRIQRLRNSSLADLVRDSLENGDWDEESFRRHVEGYLSSGRFMLVIAVDEISESLAGTIRFLNGCGNPAFSFAAVEMQRFVESGTDILVPRIYGQTTDGGTKATPGRRKRWTEKEFFEEAHMRLPAAVVEVIDDLYKWSGDCANEVRFGTGAESGSFSFYVLKKSKLISIFAVFTHGKISLSYGWLKDRIDTGALQEFHEAITAIPSMSRILPDYSKWPSVGIDEALVDKP